MEKKITRYFSDFEVEIIDKAFTCPDKTVYKQTARLTFFEEEKKLIQQIDLAYVENKTIFKLIDNQQDINLELCYIKDFSVKDYRKIRQINESKKIEINNISANHCVFHATPEHSTDFSNTVFSGDEISFNRSLFLGTSLSFFSSIFVAEAVNFEYIQFACRTVDFSHSVFQSLEVSFKNSLFKRGTKYFHHIRFSEGKKSFQNAEFGDGDVSFAYTEFNSGKTIFKMARFGVGRVDFHYANFGKGEVSFEKANFNEGSVNFRFAQFASGKKNFTRSSFGNGQISFVSVDFADGLVSFVNASFGDGKINFKLSIFGDGKIDFHYSAFGKGDLIFERTVFGKGEIDFRGTDFNEGRVNFTRSEFGDGDLIFEATELKKGRMIFRNTLFGKGTIVFASVVYPEADIFFDEVNFGDKMVSFNNARINILSLRSCYLNNYFDIRVNKCYAIDLSQTIIRDIIDLTSDEFTSDIKHINLAGIRLLGNIYMDWQRSRIKDIIYAQESSFRNKSEQFRVLKENYNGIGQYDNEDQAYVEFKRTEQIADLKDSLNSENSRFSKISAYTFYRFKWLVFDKMGLYATDPTRVLISMLIVYLLFSMLFVVLPVFCDTGIISSLFDANDPRNLSAMQKAFYHSAITFLTIGYGDYYPSGTIRWLSSAEGFIGLFLMSYFTVAFVRKILR